MNKNPYEVLGIPTNASDDEVKRAYRDLTRKYHPDANVNNPLADLAEEKFKEVQEAYDMIMKQRELQEGKKGKKKLLLIPLALIGRASCRERV